MQHIGRRLASTVSGGGGGENAKKSVQGDNIAPEAVGVVNVFVWGIVAYTLYRLNKKLDDNSNDIKRLGANIDSMIDGLDYKMNRLESNIGFKIDRLESNIGFKIDRLESNIGFKIDRLDSKIISRIDRLDSKIDRLDSKVDKQMKIIIAFAATGCLPKSFMDKVEMSPEAEKSPDVLPSSENKDN